MKSTTTHPAIVDPDRPVPLEVDVHPDDVRELTDGDDRIELLVAAGVVAERVARKHGYQLVDIDRVEADDDAVYVTGWATAAPIGGEQA